MKEEHREVFTAVLPTDVRWRRFDAFPPSVHLAILIGHPDAPGPYVVRVKASAGSRLMPHHHKEDRVYTVIEGTFYLGRGATFLTERLVGFPAGSVIVVPKHIPHFHCARTGEYVIQMTAVGDVGIDYVNASDDPRHT